ncbi:CBS domain-containing protein CBSX3, mitochondrial-like [Curcuma longa]|uniref:CBS domain-containing protein CBSX3, mitochondrial-like n=1 Tax=Curcuma longa TaxID=136217 RepID=UPI003D9E4661
MVMQGVAKALRVHGNRLKHAVLQHLNFTDGLGSPSLLTRSDSARSTARVPHKGLENVTVSELLKSKGEDESQAVYFCRTSDGVYDAVQNMVEHNVGALVVLKPGDDKLVAGIVTERDYLRKIIMQGKSATSTRVRDIMTDENKLITVNSDTNIVKAMQLMTDNHIRHVPVIDKRLVGMISIVDVVRIIIEQQHQEVQSLNEYIKGNY